MSYTVTATSPDRRRQRRIRQLDGAQAAQVVRDFRAEHPDWRVSCESTRRGSGAR